MGIFKFADQCLIPLFQLSLMCSNIDKELNQSVDDGADQFLIKRFTTKNFWLEYTVRSSKFYVNVGMK